MESCGDAGGSQSGPALNALELVSWAAPNLSLITIFIQEREHGCRNLAHNRASSIDRVTAEPDRARQCTGLALRERQQSRGKRSGHAIGSNYLDFEEASSGPRLLWPPLQLPTVMTITFQSSVLPGNFTF